MQRDRVTEATSKQSQQSKARRVQEVFPNMVGRLCRVEVMVALVTFPASPKAAYTGVNHRIDGG